jgi:hypothetical protein
MPALLVLAWFGAPACGSSTSGLQSDGSGGSAMAGSAASGGSTPEDGTSAGASGAHSAAGVNSGGGNDAGSSGASSAGKSAGGASGNAGASGAGGTSGRGCPASAPSQGEHCLPPAPLGVPCFYDDCGASGARKKATCTTAIPEIGSPIQQWTVETSTCEPLDCSGMPCPTGQACVIFEGGARIGQCASQSCGTGPIECACVMGCYEGCILSSLGPGATFTCSTCSDPRGCP